MRAQNWLLATIGIFSVATAATALGAAPPPTEEVTVTGVRPNNTTKDT